MSGSGNWALLDMARRMTPVGCPVLPRPTSMTSQRLQPAHATPFSREEHPMGFRIALAPTLLVGGTLLAASLHAQQLATITGKVTNARTGEPLAVVGVRVQGTELSAVTGEDGTYR